MKAFLIALLTATMLIPAVDNAEGQPLYEIKLELSSDISDSGGDDDHPAIVGGLGWYHWERVLFGGYCSFEKKETGYWGKSNLWGLGAYGEYHFKTESPVVPYLAASMGFLDGDEDDDTVFTLSGGAGLKVSLTKILSVSAQLDLNWADSEVYDYEWEDKDGSSTDVTANIGLRYLY
ncbi:MAG: outer membrane beta-barrel protein [Verrucomicrobiota bacterium]